MLIATVRKINCNEQQQVSSLSSVSSFGDSVLKFSTGIDIFIDIPKTEFSYAPIYCPAQSYPEKQIICKIFVHGIQWNDFLSGAPLCAYRGI